VPKFRKLISGVHNPSSIEKNLTKVRYEVIKFLMACKKGSALEAQIKKIDKRFRDIETQVKHELTQLKKKSK